MADPRSPLRAMLQSQSPANGSQRRERLPDDDDDDLDDIISGFAALKPKAGEANEDASTPTGPSSQSTNRPTFGHPTRMVSSLKQRADPFIHRKTYPEHHLSAKVNPQRAPIKPGLYSGAKGKVLPMFSSKAPPDPPTKHFGDEVFYTDPDKAGEDLKNLLEGNMDEDEEEEEGKDGPQPQCEGAKTVEKNSGIIKDGKDGTIEGLKVKLLPHQVEGVTWMRGRELGPVKRGKVPKGGILADDMGLGKTLQTVSLILTQQKPEKDAQGWKKHFEGMEKTTLVVAPLSLIRQWEHEIKDKVAKSHGLKVCVHHGPQRTKRFKDLALYDVVITTYQILVSEYGHSSEKEDGVKAGCFGLHWWRVVLDEAHTIKNRNAKATKACCALRSEYRWCLSGTPMQNNLDELQSLIKFLRIRPYDDLKEWKSHIDYPMKNGKGHIAIRRLHSVLRCFMKRRTKDILKEDGALNPGGKPAADDSASSTGFKVTERKVVAISATLSPAERTFYKRLETRADKSIAAMQRGQVNYASALTLLLRLRQACNHPKLVGGKLEKDKDAMSTDSSQKSSQGTDVDSMADMFAGMGITSKSCSICGRGLSNDRYNSGHEMCDECQSDLEYFNNQVTNKNNPKKKKKKKKEEEEEEEEEEKEKPGAKKHATQKIPTETKKPARRQRNRNRVIDSDDEEEDEGSWLVPEAERGNVRLGKAGGEEDENAEGGGDWIGNEDSEDEDDDGEDRDLSSFVVDDRTAKEEAGYKSAGDATDDDDDNSLLSIGALTQQMASQTLGSSQPEDLGSDASESETDSDSGVDESEIGNHTFSSATGDDDDEDDPEGENIRIFGPRRRSLGTGHVVASAKIREVIRLLNAETKEHKFIVFSQFTSMLDLVEPFLRKQGIRFVRYDGSMKNDEREESLRRLRGEKSVRVLLCSLKCGSLGLNLTAATRVIIIEPFWNPFVEEQAIDRVHRLTQTIDVVVYKLTAKNTIEERILDLQEKKRLLAEQAIDGGMRKDAFKLGFKEIIELFKPSSLDRDERGQQQQGGSRDNDDDDDDDDDINGAATGLAKFSDVRQVGNDLRALIKGKSRTTQRPEGGAYSRRW